MNKVMDEAHEIIQEAEASAKKWTPKLISGGRDGEDDNPDWLSRMKLGTAFLIQDKNSSEFSHGQFQLLMKSPNGKSCFLWSGLQREEVKLWVNPLRFCSKYMLVDVIHEGDDKPQGEQAAELANTTPMEETNG